MLNQRYPRTGHLPCLKDQPRLQTEVETPDRECVNWTGHFVCFARKRNTEVPKTCVTFAHLLPAGVFKTLPNLEEMRECSYEQRVYARSLGLPNEARDIQEGIRKEEIYDLQFLILRLTLSLPRVPKIKIQDESQISFVKYLNNI